ncbi:hypothetical protein [Pontibacter vulgaris]|uniref:hypothetical protein n=1 Tax=Pontibacter vulgaris TaxID=2905679 RepID=UPI001FA778CA|nr:hypothetical protein [Pontibacter vulgaris]
MQFVEANRNSAQNINKTALELKNQQGNVFVNISYQPDYIEAKWHGHITADEVVTAAIAYLQLIQEHSCPKLLNDKTEVTGDWQDANDWLEFEWLPKVRAAGLKYLAHVYSQNIFSRLSARDLIERVSPELMMRNFFNREEAINWLQQCTMPGGNRQSA